MQHARCSAGMHCIDSMVQSSAHAGKHHLAGKAHLNTQICSWGFPKSDGGKLKTSSTASGMYPTTSIPDERELTLSGMYQKCRLGFHSTMNLDSCFNRKCLLQGMACMKQTAWQGSNLGKKRATFHGKAAKQANALGKSARGVAKA